MRPKPNTAIFRPDLGSYVMEFMEFAGLGFIGLQIMPILRRATQAGTFPVIPKEVMLALEDVDRAPRGAYGRSDWDYERGLYACTEKGWEEVIDDSERAAMDEEAGGGVAEFIATEKCMKTILRRQEYRVASKLFNASNFTANAVTNEWDDAGNATPITDVADAVSAFRTQCGMLPDALVINWKVFNNLRQCDQIVNRLKYTFPGIDIARMTSAQLAAAMNVPQVMVGGAIYNANGKGLAASISDIWDDEYAALVKISNSPDVTEPCVGRTFMWTEDSPANPVVESYRENQVRGDIIRVRHTVDERLIQSFNDSGTVVSDVAAACVYLMSNITS